jgi:DTW domain-containing protein YfiP
MTCPNCLKPPEVCVCSITPSLNLKTRVLILRHPQEPDKILGSATILHRALTNSVLKTGLTWRNLSAALAPPRAKDSAAEPVATPAVDPRAWGVLFLGTTKGAKQQIHIGASSPDTPSAKLDGLVLLDGNWRQAKALWWRNPWLLKLTRIVLEPQSRSLYGNLRREPRNESLSTLEAAAFALARLEQNPSIQEKLFSVFSVFLDRCKQSLPQQTTNTDRTAHSRDRRRRKPSGRARGA